MGVVDELEELELAPAIAKDCEESLNTSMMAKATLQNIDVEHDNLSGAVGQVRAQGRLERWPEKLGLGACSTPHLTQLHDDSND